MSGRRSVRGGGKCTPSPTFSMGGTDVQPCIYVWQNPWSELSLTLTQEVAKGLENPLQLTDEPQGGCVPGLSPWPSWQRWASPLPSPGPCQLSLKEGGLLPG